MSSNKYLEIQRLLESGQADKATDALHRWQASVSSDQLLDFVSETFNLLYYGDLKWDDEKLRRFILSRKKTISVEQLWKKIL